jgi:phospholipase C
MRKLLAYLAVMTAVLLPAPTAAAMPTSNAPTTTPIKHFVMLMQDNHSFDNYFGTYPGADGIPAGVCQRLNLARSSTTGCVKPFRLGTTPSEDLSQGAGIQKRQYNNGKMDGFVAAYRRLGLDGSSTMGYYDGGDLPYYWNTAEQFVLFDRFFSSTTVGSRESYLYWLAGQAPRSARPLTTSAGYDNLPTIFDRLHAKQVTAKFYVENLDARVTAPGRQNLARSSQVVKVPLLSMKRFQDRGPLAGKIVDLSEYYLDLRRGTLPAVSYIVTSGSSENPPARVDVGQKAVRKLTSELIKSPYWESSAFMWTYDGWGGWYDHVPPPRVDDRGYGFRVPALLVSPYAKRGVVDHSVLDYTAMLKFIEMNWSVEPLAERDAGSLGLGSAFDFNTGPRSAALIPATRSPEAAAIALPHATPVIYTTYGLALTVVAAAVGVLLLIRRPLHELLRLPAWSSLRSLAGSASYQPRHAIADVNGVRVNGVKGWQDAYHSSYLTASGTTGRRTGAAPDDGREDWTRWHNDFGYLLPIPVWTAWSPGKAEQQYQPRRALDEHLGIKTWKDRSEEFYLATSQAIGRHAVVASDHFVAAWARWYYSSEPIAEPVSKPETPGPDQQETRST